MSERRASIVNNEIAQRVQEKFEFYFVALTFTILGLSIQTAGFGLLAVADVAEVLAWVLMMVSGLLGLFRLERSSHVYYLLSLKYRNEERIQDLTRLSGGQVHALETGQQIDPLEQTRVASENVEVVDEALKAQEERLMRVYKWHRGLFLGGLVALMVARGLPPLLDLTR